jgi:ABC-type glycerol-3-phosphate transport system substrate-binding protein
LIDWNNDGKVSGIAASIDVVLCLNTNSQHKDEAWRWMRYLATKGQDVLINQSMSYCPSRTDIQLNVQGLSENGKQNLDFIVETASTSISGFRTIPYADLDQQLQECLSALATGEMTPEAAAAAMQSVSAAIER